MPYPRTRAGRVLPPTILVLALLAALAGCGSPEYTYVKNSDAKAYFKVPAKWQKIDQKTLDEALSSADPASATAEITRKLSWSIAYDANQSPDPNHLLIGSDQPFVYANIRRLTEAQHSVISLNLMRNIFLPVTEDAREQAAQSGSGLPGFELLRDEVLNPSDGVRGVRVTYNYAIPPLPTLQTFDVTSYSRDDGRLYWLVLRCSARCYKERRGEFDDIVKSFTVRKRS